MAIEVAGRAISDIAKEPTEQEAVDTVTLTTEPDSFANLPPDLVLRIFKVLRATDRVSTATCLGITCRRFYLIMKSLWPEPIPLYRKEWNDHEDELGCVYQDLATPRFIMMQRLQGFIGPKYRIPRKGFLMWPEHTPRFLAKAAYGEEDSDAEGKSHPAEVELFERQRTWEAMSLAIVNNYRKLGPHQSVEDVLPKPYNEGPEWWSKVRDITSDED